MGVGGGLDFTWATKARMHERLGWRREGWGWVGVLVARSAEPHHLHLAVSLLPPQPTQTPFSSSRLSSPPTANTDTLFTLIVAILL